jgi:hypothetical protein
MNHRSNVSQKETNVNGKPANLAQRHYIGDLLLYGYNNVAKAKKAPRFPAGLLLNRKEEIPSFADLAATYSSKP